MSVLASGPIGMPGGRIRVMDKRSCRECGGEVLILPCADLGGRRVAFEVFEVPVASLPDLRRAWAYLRHRGGGLPCRAVPGPGPGVAAAPLRSERVGAIGPGRRRLALTRSPRGDSNRGHAW